jgi:hypothetical protein
MLIQEQANVGKHACLFNVHGVGVCALNVHAHATWDAGRMLDIHSHAAGDGGRALEVHAYRGGHKGR